MFRPQHGQLKSGVVPSTSDVHLAPDSDASTSRDSSVRDTEEEKHETARRLFHKQQALAKKAREEEM